MRSFLLFVLVLLLASQQGSSFIPSNANRRDSPGVAMNGIFDKFIQNMEAGYKGEDSAFQKQKAADEAKRNAQKKSFEARKAKGYTELKDVKERSFAKTKYGDAPEKPQEKKLFGLF